MSCIRLLFMIQVQISVNDLHKGHLGSDDVILGHQQVFANNSRLNRATYTCMVSLCWSCQHASPDVQHDLLGSTCDHTWPWPEVRILTRPFKVTINMFQRALTRRARGSKNYAVSFLSWIVICKTNDFAPNGYFYFLIPGAKTVDASSNPMTS